MRRVGAQPGKMLRRASHALLLTPGSFGSHEEGSAPCPQLADATAFPATGVRPPSQPRPTLLSLSTRFRLSRLRCSRPLVATVRRWASGGYLRAPRALHRGRRQ
jgi:hypothetical protein